MIRIATRAAAAAALLCLGLALPSPGAAESAAVPAGTSTARASFERFAETWMQKLKKVEGENRQQPQAASGGGVTYRGYGSEFGMELRPTGHSYAPFVGILRYKERKYACTDARATSCVVATTTPVTELFRYQNGRWIY